MLTYPESLRLVVAYDSSETRTTKGKKSQRNISGAYFFVIVSATVVNFIALPIPSLSDLEFQLSRHPAPEPHLLQSPESVVIQIVLFPSASGSGVVLFRCSKSLLSCSTSCRVVFSNIPGLPYPPPGIGVGLGPYFPFQSHASHCGVALAQQFYEYRDPRVIHCPAAPRSFCLFIQSDPLSDPASQSVPPIKRTRRNFFEATIFSNHCQTPVYH